jgi:hypothetical protein
MLTLGSLRPVAASRCLSELVLQGRVHLQRLSESRCQQCPSDMTVWPSFLTGRCWITALPCEGDPLGSDFKITGPGLFTRPPPTAQSNERMGNDAPRPPHQKSHALGASALAPRTSWAPYCWKCQIATVLSGTVTSQQSGFSCGMAANKRELLATCPCRRCCLHSVPHSTALWITIDVTSRCRRCCDGAGLLFQRSSHRMMTEFLLNRNR